MVVKPTVTPDNTPVAFTVTTALLAEDQVPPVVELAKMVVEPAHTVVAPVMASITGSALTTNGELTVVTQPLAMVTV